LEKKTNQNYSDHDSRTDKKLLYNLVFVFVFGFANIEYEVWDQNQKEKK